MAFKGVGDTADRAPADPDIAVGPSDVFEIAEPDFQIFSSTGTALTSAAGNNVLWTGIGGPCASLTTGDWSQVIYDQLAGKFVYTRTTHVEKDSVASAYECIAVSETSDPTGAWYLYSALLSSGNNAQTDYPQFGFSAAAYYLGVNLWTGAGGSGQFEGDRLVAINRAELLSGKPAQVASVTLSSQYETYIPVTLEGTTPEPTGGAELFIGGPSDFLVAQGGAASALSAFAVTPTWSTSGSGSTLNVRGPFSLNTGPYNVDICGIDENCAVQPGTTTELEAWSDNLMLPIVYRNFGSYQSIVGTFDVNVNGRPEPEWVEFRFSGTGLPQLYQEGVFSPGSASRFEQSIGVDDSGDIALAYTISGPAIYPSLAATYRDPGMALGTMGQEQGLWAGKASQTPSSPGLGSSQTPSRWGDASYLALAPDGCTFWYANAYYPSATSVWETAIVSFSVPGCVPAAAAKRG